MADILVISTMLVTVAVIVLGDLCNWRFPQNFYAAKKRVLKQFAYAVTAARSPIICERTCAMEKRCQSFNFYESKKQCELNNVTVADHLSDFFEDWGSVYFDGYEGTTLYSLADIPPDEARSCRVFFERGYRTSTVYTIYPSGVEGDGIQVYCDMETDGGGWVVFQRRQDGSVDFYRNWTEYQYGFGDLSGEFWLGNDNLVKLTANGEWNLRVDLGDWVGGTAWAKYNGFSISSGQYTLNLRSYDVRSTAGDSIGPWHNGRPFSTMDYDNDAWNNGQCAQKFLGAWWFNDCWEAHLNGKYNPDQFEGTCYGCGIVWFHWKNEYNSLKSCSMKFREI